ncbi:PQQ-binding-like beta-propeller repeat protein [Krasilnikovia sp. MM14-A1259]|uniref:PQQ-binding-like beta-propeller repeat protein n=1 Tax=Krasilnikovia sp. MM14-A1259 TaxID=3373539 RepID=UPI003805872A
MRAYRALLTHALTLALLVVGTSVPALAATADWTHPGYGPGNTFVNPAESAITARTIADVALRWSAGLPEVQGGSCSEATPPLVSGGRAFVADEAGIGAYRITTGRQIWHRPWSSPQEARTPALAVSGNLLLVGITGCASVTDPGGRILALNVATGREKWRFDDGRPVASLLVDRGVVVADGGSDNFSAQVRAFRVRDGKRRWALDGYALGATADGRLLVHRAYRSGVTAVAVTTGRRLWSAPIGTRVKAGANGRFYVTDGADLVSLRAANGSVVWRAPGVEGTIAVDGRRVYHALSNGVDAWDVRTGLRLWQAGFEGDAGQPVVAGGLVYTTVDAGEPLGILDAATGAVASPATQFPSLDSGHVVLSGGQLYLIDGHRFSAYAP